MESWLESNPNGILEDGKLLIIGRQITTNLGSIMDLLGIDREGNTVILELKRNKTPRETLAQALEYASFVEELNADQIEEIFQHYVNDDTLCLAEYHKNYFELESDEAVSFNKDQRIVIVGQKITSEIRQAAKFLRKKGMRVTCLEFSFFEAEDGKNLLSYEIVVGKEPKRIEKISSGALPVVSKKTFLESLDENGKNVFTRLIKYAEKESLPLHWGTKGFSMNVDKSGTHVAICYGYPPAAVFKQSVYTALIGRGGFLSKLDASEADIRHLWDDAQATGLFQPAGKELKIVIDRKLSDDEIKAVINWLRKLVKTVEKNELK